MVPLPRRFFVRNVAATLDDQEGRDEHVGADVAMLDEIPDRDGQAKHADAVGAVKHFQYLVA